MDRSAGVVPDSCAAGLLRASRRGAGRLARISLLSAALLLAGSVPAHAAPIVWVIQPGGTATATAQVGITMVGVFNFSSIGGTVTLDSTTQALLDLDVTLGSTGLTALVTPYGGYDRVEVSSVSLGQGTGFSSSVPVNIGGTHQMHSGPVSVAAVFSAQDSTGTYSPVTGVPLNFEAITMTVLVTPNGPTFIQFTGLPVAVIDPTLLTLPVAEAHSLIAFGNFSFLGLPVPEPSGLGLLGLGIAVVAAGSWRRVRSG